MNDPYVYENSRVLKNLLNIMDEKELDLAEAELSRANMMILYEQGFGDFLRKDCVQFTNFCLGTYMIGQGNTGSSISKNGKRF